jgi:hypothetical protein
MAIFGQCGYELDHVLKADFTPLSILASSAKVTSFSGISKPSGILGPSF